MTHLQSLNAEAGLELTGTQKLLDELPSDLAWSPRPGQWSIGELAQHIANLPLWGTTILTTDILDLENLEGSPSPDMSTGIRIRQVYKERSKVFRETLANYDEPRLLEEWQLKRQGQTLSKEVRLMALRRSFFNHFYHHRGQLITLIRASGNDVPQLF